MQTHIYYQRIIPKYKCLFSLFFSFLPSLNWERAYVIAILRKGGGRKQSYGLLSFLTGSFWEYFLFYGLAGFFYSMAWRHQLSSCPRFFPLFSGILVAVSIHLITSTAVLKTPALLLRPEFGMRFARPFTATSVFKTDFFLSVSADEEKSYFCF